MKRFFRKMARRIVTIYANRQFRKAMKVADSWRNATGKRYYVISDPTDDSRLVAIDISGFLKICRLTGIKKKAELIPEMKKTCWYYTPNKEGRDVIPAKELIIRRLAFVRELMGKAKLLD